MPSRKRKRPTKVTLTKMRKRQSLDALATIKDIRIANNDLWMKILRIAVEARPKKTRAILQAIRTRDEMVTEWLKQV